MKPVKNTITERVPIGSVWTPLDGGGAFSLDFGFVIVDAVSRGIVTYHYARHRSPPFEQDIDSFCRYARYNH